MRIDAVSHASLLADAMFATNATVETRTAYQRYRRAPTKSSRPAGPTNVANYSSG